jgi:ribosomal protein S18 acetylase RimI-like enzyme
VEEPVLSAAMGDPSLVFALESRLVNAWPSFETQLCDGWLLRLARGYSKRANSATPIIAGAAVDDALVDHLIKQFLSHNVRPTFRLTGLESPDVDAQLAARGFDSTEPSFGMVSDIASGEWEIDGSVTLDQAVSKRWVRETATSYGGDKADDSILIEIVSRIRQPHMFASLDLDGTNVAWGLGVAERGYVGLYDIVVSPELRGLGLGRQIVTSLMAWGRSEGATVAYLQVREENEVARALYASLGFRDAYRYTHRVMR